MRARVLKAEYNPKTDVVTWECIVLDDNSPYFLHWPRAEYGPKVAKINAVVPVKMLEDHLPQLVGKEFNLDQVYVPPDQDIGKLAMKAGSFLSNLDPSKHTPPWKRT